MSLLLTLFLLLPLLLFPLLVRYLSMKKMKIKVLISVFRPQVFVHQMPFIWPNNPEVYLWFLDVGALCCRLVVTAVGGCCSADWAGSWGTLALAGLAERGANEPFGIDGCCTQLEQVLLITWWKEPANAKRTLSITGQHVLSCKNAAEQTHLKAWSIIKLIPCPNSVILLTVNEPCLTPDRRVRNSWLSSGSRCPPLRLQKKSFSVCSSDHPQTHAAVLVNSAYSGNGDNKKKISKTHH